MTEPRVICPKCGHRFPVTEALTQQIEESLRQQFETEAKERENVARAAYEKRLAIERAKLEKEAIAGAKKASAGEVSKLRDSLAAFERREKAARADFDRQLAAERSRARRDALKEANASVAGQIESLRRQVKDGETRIRKIQTKEADLQRREQDIDQLIAREVDTVRKKTQQETTAKVEKDYRTRELQHDKMVIDLKKQLNEAKRKLEQSSQQTQGEVIELEIERVLSATFTDDKIEPIAKGKLGADIVHRVFSSSGQHCGTIVWESKNTKSWSQAWLSKLRSDQRRVKAEIAVIVSSVLPKDVRGGFGQHSGGAWITDFPLVTGLAAALRANLIDVARIRAAAEGKPEKMEVLYQYLMSTEFRQRVEAIVEAFQTMKADLDREKQTTQKHWAKREKNLELVLHGVAGMVGDIHGIAPAFPRIKRLELPPVR